MAKSLFWLSDEAWEALGPHLPRGRPGKPRVDDRTVISGILHVSKTGCRWRDVPPVYGPPTTIYNRYNRWSQRRVWQRIFEKMAAAGPIPDELSIDIHLLAIRIAWEGDLADAGDGERVHESGQDREYDQRQDRRDDLSLPSLHVSRGVRSGPGRSVLAAGRGRTSARRRG